MIHTLPELVAGLDAPFTGRVAGPADPNHASLGVALARLCGAPETRSSAPDDETAATAEELVRTIGGAEHYVFLMLDGFGMNFVDELPDNSFAKSSVSQELSAVFPTSTGPNLVSIGTGAWPIAHGNLGWHVFIPRLGERITSLLWQRTSDGKSLTEVGFAPQELLRAPMADFGARGSYTHVTDANIVGSPWTNITGQRETRGYEYGANAVAQVVEHVAGVIAEAAGPTFTYVYWMCVDSLAHGEGIDHPMTRLAVGMTDALVEHLAEAVHGKATLIATADHGHVRAGEDAYDVILPDDPLRDMLMASPGGEERMMYFHAAAGQSENFAAQFQDRFGERFMLMRSADAIECGLLGPPSSADPAVRERAGDFIAVSRGIWAMAFPDPARDYSVNKSTHGGITDSETQVPLIVCR